ncbi:MAG: hypothetical protein ACRC8S_12045 [Fimbriiglobus sp.]
MAEVIEVHCGQGCRDQATSTKSRISLDIGSVNSNIRFQVQKFSSQLHTNLTSILVDLLEVAAYVYSADQTVKRKPGVNLTGESWQRRFRMQIPVRNPNRWNSEGVKSDLSATLAFMTDDTYTFEFRALQKTVTRQMNIDYTQAEVSAGDTVDEVALYSGGLDSLAGVVDAARNREKKTLLIQHRSHNKWVRFHDLLETELTSRLAPYAPRFQTFEANKSAALTADTSQRTRMFLYSSLGAVAAQLHGLQELQIYENGVVSWNLPILGQLVGTRASRTTHPRTLDLLMRFFSTLFGNPFGIRNHFRWKTKSEILQILDEAGFSDLIGTALSCSETHLRSNAKTHCGSCSQCLDRRFGVLAAGLEANDSADRYEIELVHGRRAKPDQRSLLVGFVDRARRIDQMTQLQFFSEYGHFARGLSQFQESPSETARQLWDLYRRHSCEVMQVLQNLATIELPKMLRGEIEPTSLMGITLLPPAEIVEVPEEKPQFQFLEQGDFWEVSFNSSEPRMVKDSKGMGMIGRLLQSPGREIPNNHLCSDTPPIETRIENGVPQSDAETLQACRNRLAELEEEMEPYDPDDVPTSLQTEQHEIEDYLRKTTNNRGGIRETNSQREQARKLVSNNIDNAIKAIREYLPECAEHLKKCIIRENGCCTYQPAETIAWVLE